MSIRAKSKSTPEAPKPSPLAAKLSSGPEAPKTVTMDDLNPVEQAAAKLEVDPDQLRPIEWLNAKHYESLKKANSLSSDLQRRIEAYRHVASTAPSS